MPGKKIFAGLLLVERVSQVVLLYHLHIRGIIYIYGNITEGMAETSELQRAGTSSSDAISLARSNVYRNNNNNNDNDSDNDNGNNSVDNETTKLRQYHTNGDDLLRSVDTDDETTEVFYTNYNF